MHWNRRYFIIRSLVCEACVLPHPDVPLDNPAAGPWIAPYVFSLAQPSRLRPDFGILHVWLISFVVKIQSIEPQTSKPRLHAHKVSDKACDKERKINPTQFEKCPNFGAGGDRPRSVGTARILRSHTGLAAASFSL